MYLPPLASLQAFGTAYNQSDFFGKLIFLGLFALSALCWVILIQKILAAKKVRKQAEDFRSLLEKQGDNLLSFEIGHILPGQEHPYLYLYKNLREKCLEILNKNHYFTSQLSGKEKGSTFLSEADFDLLESQALTQVSMQIKRLEKNIYLLSTITTLAPFLGLLGTVWGILMTFSGLQQSGAVSSNSAVLGGLSTALATTVLGLVIAIPSLIAHSYLKNTMRIFTSDMEDFLYNLLATLELQYRRVDLSNQ